QLCSGDGIPSGGVHHDDASLGGGFDVDIINPDASTANDTQLFGCLDNCLGDFGFGTNQQGDGVVHQWEQFGLGEAFGQNNDFEPGTLFQKGDAFWRHGITDQNLHQGMRSVGQDERKSI